MVPITRADEELFGTMVAAIRLGRARSIVERLSRHYEQEWDDPLAGYPLALSMVAVLQYSTDDAVVQQTSYNEIIETLGDLLYHSPDHWLGRYLRIRTRALVPLDGEYPEFAASERVRAAEDAEELIARQSKVSWQPWFACPYLLAARLVWESGERDPDRAGALVSAAAAQPSEPIRFRSLASVLCDGFVWYCSQPGVPERETAQRMLGTLFGREAPGFARRPSAVR